MKQRIYPSFRVSRTNGHSSYYLIASPTNCVEFVEERKAGNEFGFLIRTLKSRTVVKSRETWSSPLDRDVWFAEVKASMLAHLECAMEMVDLCNSVRAIKAKPRLADFKEVASEAEGKFDWSKRGLARMMLIEAGAAEDTAHAMLLLGQ